MAEDNPELVANLKERIGQLTSGIVQITVGGTSEAEIGEKYDRLDDAICATRAAMQRGIVSGGGATLLHAANHITIDHPTPDTRHGMEIVKIACEEPI